MSESSVAHAHVATSPDVANELLDRIEAELTRLERGRPRLAETARKAANILVSHLAGRPRTPVIRVRITPSGKARFLFHSLTNSGAVYTVTPESWSCSCPAFHRYEPPCKHGLAAWVLWRVAQPDRSHGMVIRRDPDGCPACENGLIRLTKPYVNTATGELTHRTLTLPCRTCGGAA